MVFPPLQIFRFLFLCIILCTNKINYLLICQGLGCSCLRFTGCKFIKLHITHPSLHFVPHIWSWGKWWLLRDRTRIHAKVFEACFAILNDAWGGFLPCIVAATMSSCLRSAFASLLFSTLTRYLSANFFLYLLFTDMIIPWPSGCITNVEFGGSIRNLMLE